MSALAGKRIVAGICGGIAAYKAAHIVSKLVQAGAEVRVLMTRAARQFVTPMTFETLSHHKVLTDLWEEPLAHVESAYRQIFLCSCPRRMILWESSPTGSPTIS
jgi:phosphopantothenoylcysteine decarboxylase/phosphopantothenate--cysteine ligase